MIDTTLIDAMQNPAIYPHPVDSIQLVETYISWVILTGDYVYKLKKPVDFEYLDFTTLDKRKAMVEREVRLNQRTAPAIYLGVVPITGTAAEPVIGGDGPVIDYAVKSKQFPQSQLLDRLLASDAVPPTIIRRLALQIAALHAQAEVATGDQPWGEATAVHQPVQQNFDQIRPLLSEASDQQLLTDIEAITQAQFSVLESLLTERKQRGFVRECHGDLHAGNIVVLDDTPCLFDNLEFNEAFLWTDVMADIGFMHMDLLVRNQTANANQLLSDYLEASQDYQGLAVFRYYAAYRAMVRAKVANFGLHTQAGLTDDDKRQQRKEYRDYVALAGRYFEPSEPQLVITFGLSGTGKSTLAKQWVSERGMVAIQSDVIRQQLAGDLSTEARYSQAMNQQVYQTLANQADTILAAGYSVIVDAAFLKQRERDQFANLAEQHQVPFAIAACDASLTTRTERIQHRQQQNDDPSEADVSVMQQQAAWVEPLTAVELTLVID